MKKETNYVLGNVDRIHSVSTLLGMLDAVESPGCKMILQNRAVCIRKAEIEAFLMKATGVRVPVTFSWRYDKGYDAHFPVIVPDMGAFNDFPQSFKDRVKKHIKENHKKWSDFLVGFDKLS